jgi:hypothetical protein
MAMRRICIKGMRLHKIDKIKMDEKRRLSAASFRKKLDYKILKHVSLYHA